MKKHEILNIKQNNCTISKKVCTRLENLNVSLCPLLAIIVRVCLHQLKQQNLSIKASNWAGVVHLLN